MEGQVIENAVQETVQETVDKVSSNWDQIKAYFNGHIPDLISFGMKVVLSIVAFYVGTKLIKCFLKLARRSMEKAGIDKGVAQFASLCLRHCSTCVAQIIRGMMI